MNHYYACGNYLTKGIAACKPNSVRADDIEEWLFSQLQAIVSSAQIVKRLSATVRDKQFRSSSPLQEQANRLQQELNLLEAERLGQFQAYEDGAITKEELKEYIGHLQRRSQELQAMEDNLNGSFGK